MHGRSSISTHFAEPSTDKRYNTNLSQLTLERDYGKKNFEINFVIHKPLRNDNLITYSMSQDVSCGLV